MTPRENDPNRWVSPFEELLGNQAGVFPAAPAPVQQPSPFIGTPGNDAAFWDGQQRLPDDCAIKCQQFILNQFAGLNVDEGMLVHEAMEHGWYQPGAGTPPEFVGRLLELHGVGVHQYQHASQFDLAAELAQGHKVIVGVDSAKLLGENPIMSAIRDYLGMSGADHAVVISGIDTSDPLHVRVIVSDPGTGEAIGTCPLEHFVEAWGGSDFFLMATNEPAPAHLPEMAHFDYGLGHIPEIADVPYEQFLEYASHPADWSGVVHHYVEVHHFIHVDPFVDHMHDSHVLVDVAPSIYDPVDLTHADPYLPNHQPDVHDLHDVHDGSGAADGYDHFPADDLPADQLPDDWN